MAKRTETLDYGRVISYFLCLYLRKIQKHYSEAQYNPLLVEFKDECNRVINNGNGEATSSKSKLEQLGLDFQSQQSGFHLEMKFADVEQADAYWRQIEILEEFPLMKISQFLEEDPNSKLFLITLLSRQSKSSRQGNLISLDLPGYEAFLAEVMRWSHQSVKPQIQ